MSTGKRRIKLIKIMRNESENHMKEQTIKQTNREKYLYNINNNNRYKNDENMNLLREWNDLFLGEFCHRALEICKTKKIAWSILNASKLPFICSAANRLRHFFLRFFFYFFC